MSEMFARRPDWAQYCIDFAKLTTLPNATDLYEFPTDSPHWKAAIEVLAVTKLRVDMFHEPVQPTCAFMQ